MGRTAARFRIEGRVQGVGYRWWTIRQARALGVEGWVRNLDDGAVEILALGPSPALAALERVCAQGPSAARVTTVVRSPAEDDGSRGFEEGASA